MKTGNTLRTAKNSLLCFFMALAGGFLVACGGDGVRFTGGGTPTPMTVAMTVVAPSVSPSVTISPQLDLPTVNFSSYLFDTAAEGVEYSGPTGNGVTGEGGVFLASEGVFEFSIGATPLGSVQIRSQDEDNEVTPADFMGVDDAQVVTIARIMQGLDLGNDLKDGISISQGAREHPEDLSALLDNMGTVQITAVVIGGDSYTIPSVADARDHLADTRKCLFSGGYVGDYSGVDTSNDPLAGGRVYYAVEPFANRVKRFGLGNVQDLLSVAISSTVGVTGSAISLTVAGNELFFTTPGLVTGTWADGDIGSGTLTLTLAADTGNPGATRRIVGVETTDDTAATVSRLYVLDHFSGDGSFRGQYYSVDASEANQSVSIEPLSLTIAGGVSWPTVTVATMLTLIGDNATIAVEVVRANDNYGSFDGVFADDGSDTNELSGTWCDIGGAVGSTVAPTPPTPLIEIAVMWSEVEGATFYELYRSTMTVSVGSTVSVTHTPVGGNITSTVYTDTPPAGPAYFYRVEACNSAGCSGDDPDPAAGGGDGGTVAMTVVAPAQPSAPSASAQSATEIEVTWSAVSSATSYKLYRSTTVSGSTLQVGGDLATTTYTDSELSANTDYFYQLEACNSAGCSELSPEVSVTTMDDGQCRETQRLMIGESCEWKGHTFTVELDGTGTYASLSGGTGIRQTGSINEVQITFIATKSGNVWVIEELGPEG